MSEPTRYRTRKGSTVEISGAHLGTIVDFDWFEEGACIEARRNVSVEVSDEPMLYWSCECCGLYSARLTPDK